MPTHAGLAIAVVWATVFVLGLLTSFAVAIRSHFKKRGLEKPEVPYNVVHIFSGKKVWTVDD